MSSSGNFLIRYAPDCTFLSRKIKKLPTVGTHSHTLPPLGRYAPSGLVASLPRKDCAPKCLAHYATCTCSPCMAAAAAATATTTTTTMSSAKNMVHAMGRLPCLSLSAYPSQLQTTKRSEPILAWCHPIHQPRNYPSYLLGTSSVSHYPSRPTCPLYMQSCTFTYFSART